MTFFSTSADGRVASWTLVKNELRMDVVMQLKSGASGRAAVRPWSASVDGTGRSAGPTTTARNGAATPLLPSTASVNDGADVLISGGDGASRSSGAGGRNGALSAGTCFAFHPFDERM